MPKGQVKDMYYEQELLFLKDTLRRCGIQVGFIDEESLPQRYWQTGPYSLMVDERAFVTSFSQTMPPIQPATVYSLTDDFSCHYLYFALPEPGRDALVTIGPYLNEAVTPERIMEAAEKEGVASAVAQQLIKYYYSVPLIPKTSHLFVMLDAFFERLWGANGYTMEHLSRRLPADLPVPDAASAQTPQSRLRQMEMMEIRYAMENALMDAISIRHLENKRADRLSGGETARMALVRLMMKSYDLVLLDEPTAAMDMETTLLSEKLILEYVRETGCALLLVTHSLQQARRIADEVLYFHKGKLLETGPQETVLTAPAMAETRQFLDFYGI